MKPSLNRKLILEAPVHSPDGAGGGSTDWTALGTLWAQVIPGTGRERGDGAATHSQVPTKVVVRGAPVGNSKRPKPDQRFREGARTYDILAVREWDAQGRYLLCHTQEEVTS